MKLVLRGVENATIRTLIQQVHLERHLQRENTIINTLRTLIN